MITKTQSAMRARGMKTNGMNPNTPPREWPASRKTWEMPGKKPNGRTKKMDRKAKSSTSPIRTTRAHVAWLLFVVM
jgi:hypothetical protein